jgi:hypothetical protein
MFITRRFLKKIAQDGRILDGLKALESLSAEDRAALPELPGLTSWECMLEEVLDTDHDPEYYARFANELLRRGYTQDDIQEMRLVAWETAGWFNFEMMAWDWCHLSESDMLLGLENRFQQRNISRERHDELRAKIEHYREPPNMPAKKND